MHGLVDPVVTSHTLSSLVAPVSLLAARFFRDVNPHGVSLSFWIVSTEGETLTEALATRILLMVPPGGGASLLGVPEHKYFPESCDLYKAMPPPGSTTCFP